MLDSNLRERLLALESETSSLKEKYQKEMEAMMEKPLSPIQKLGWMAGVLFGVFIFFGGFAAVGLLGAQFPFYLNLIFVLVSFYGIAGALYSLYIVVQGKVNIKLDRMIELVLIWAFGSVVILVFMLYAATTSNPAEGALKLLFAYPTLFILVLATLHRYIERTSAETKEHLLRLELQLAELNEKLSKQSSTHSSGE